MHQPAFLSNDTISYTKALANPTPNFLEGLLAWISASVQGPIESARDPDRKRELEALKKSADDDPFGADAKVWSATSDAYEQFRKTNRAKALAAIGSGNLYFVYERRGGGKRLVVRTPTELLASAEFPPEVRLENIQMAMAVVLSIYGPKTDGTETCSRQSQTGS